MLDVSTALLRRSLFVDGARRELVIKRICHFVFEPIHKDKDAAQSRVSHLLLSVLSLSTNRFTLLTIHTYFTFEIPMLNWAFYARFFKKVFWPSIKTFLAFSWFQYQSFLSKNLRVLMICTCALKDNVKSCMYTWKMITLKSKVKNTR